MIYAEVDGGSELLAWFGAEPTFGDAEIISVTLNRKGVSTLSIHNWTITDEKDFQGCRIEKHAIVTFSLEQVIDLQLDAFSVQNVINELILKRATDRGRSAYFAGGDPLDIEIELLPCYGLNGFIRAKKVSISIVEGRPTEFDLWRQG